MTAWNLLQQELDAWGDAGRQVTLWWRDDDAAEPTEPLDRLLGLAEKTAVALALAVIPARCGDALSKRIDQMPDSVLVLQHGFAHQNHAAEGEKKIELGPERAATEVLGEISRGAILLRIYFASRSLPILVPPWNRIDPDLVPRIPHTGLRGLSTHGPRASNRPVKGLWQTNTHLDIMRWKEPRGFLGEEALLTFFLDHLRLRRAAEGNLDPSEPTGLLTHHLAHDDAAWDFLSRLLPLLAGHPACRFLDAAEAFSLNDHAPAGERA